MKERPYLFLELTNSVCSKCLLKVEAKVISEGNSVYMLKFCPEHKYEKVLVSEDKDYYMLMKKFIKPGQLPLQFNTGEVNGCPYDCGLCPGHEQHSCLSIVEITDACNLNCPVCYAESGTHKKNHRSLAQISRMLDAVIANEGVADIVQLSGGEPTIHPDFFEILAEAKKRPIRHLMINTNGLRIAQEPGFAKRISEYKPGIEIYLQFDSLKGETWKDIRGVNLLKLKMKALENLNELNISTTLVTTLKRGVNDDEIGDLIDFASKQRAVRGITFQPVQVAGRTQGVSAENNRLTLTGVRAKILEQFPLFKPADMIPVPCHPDCLSMGYAIKTEDGLMPITSLIDPEILIQGEKSTIIFEGDPKIKSHLFQLLSTGHSPDSAAESLNEMLCCLPKIVAPAEMNYENVFRVLIVQFMDQHSMDIRSVKRSCIHIVHPDGRLIPFDTYNLFYREGKSLPKGIKPPVLTRPYSEEATLGT